MWVYLQSEPTLWTVGFYEPNGRFVPESDHHSSAAAADRVHWLNGGSMTVAPALDDDDGDVAAFLADTPPYTAADDDQ